MTITLVGKNVLIMPHTKDNIKLAYDKGLISFETMRDKLTEFAEAEELRQEAC